MMRRAALLLAAMLAACGPAGQGVAATRIKADPAVMDGAFRPGFQGSIPDKPGVPMQMVEVGQLKLTSGRVVAVDPLVRYGAKPFTVTVPPGDYPVRLAVAKIGEGHFRVALARIDFSDRPVVRWEMALTEGEDPRTLGPQDVFTYGVDAGLGSFGDADAFAALGEEADESRDEAWIAAGEARAEALGFPYGFVLMADAGPANIAMFHSGWGDGGYASWFGFDAEGRPAALVTDFAVITAVTGLKP